MSESTDVNREQSGTPHRSRREQRKAERAAEREAYLTGQQPLLTRREMRRLQEEAEALREAIAAGELTEEEALALQDPTYEGENLAVLAGVVQGKEPVVNAELDDDEPDEPAAELDGPEEVAAPSWSAAAEPLDSPEPAASRWQSPASPEPAAEPYSSRWSGSAAPERTESYSYAPGPEDTSLSPWGRPVAPEPVQPVVPDLPEPVHPTPVDSMVPDLVPPEAPAPDTSGASYRDDSLRGAASAEDSWSDDDAEPPAQQGAEGYSSDEVSAIAAMETGVLDAADLAAIDEDELSSASSAGESLPLVPERRSLFEAASQQDDAAYAAGLPSAGSPERGTAYESAPSPESLVTPYGIASPAGFASPDSSAWEEEGEAPAPTSVSPSTPARRPIVRIPSTVQGVRTVDRDTGELSSVQPVDDEFSGIDNPEWKALRDAEGADLDVEDDAVGAPEPVYAPTPEEPETVDEAVAAEADADVRELTAPVTEERKGRGSRRTLLIALVALVVILVVATVVWFVLVRGGNVFAVAALLEPFTPLIV